ncbi:MAG: glycosyltransferase family protein [Bacteroidota bacterium]
MPATGKTIIVAPLNWGLGHATRCIPIIRELIKNNHRVVISTYGNSEAVLKKEFPQLEFFTIKGIHAEYPKGKMMKLKMFLQLPQFLQAISREHVELQKLIEKTKADLVISDNRYGFFTKKIPCYFITHQVFIKAGIFSFLTNYLNRYYLKKYTEVWIPDSADEKNNLSGTLSHGKTNLNLRFTGPLSRFEYEPSKEIKYKYTAVISGPEPQRALFEKGMTDFLLQNSVACAIAGGMPGDANFAVKNNVTFYTYADSEIMKELLLSSEIILCRSGYTSVMELVAMKKKVIFFPTPGQTEQEYLEKYLQLKNELHTGENIIVNGTEKPVLDLGKINIDDFNSFDRIIGEIF